MIKFIHCADIHADSKMGTHFTKEEADRRREEIVDAFGRMVLFAKENRVQAVIISGDLFDTKSSQKRTIKKRISYVISQNPQIDFLYLRGNHDEGADFFAEENLTNLKTFSKEGWNFYSYQNVDIYGREFSDSIPTDAYSQLNLDASRVNIVALHGQVVDYKTKDGAPEISLPKLANQNIDYIALGHIHDFKMEKLDKRCTWCYPGCLEGRGFDECGTKGFVLLTVDGAKVSAEFIPNSQRVIHEISVNVEGLVDYSEILGAVTEGVSKIKSSDIVQVDLTGEISEDTEIDLDSYQSAMASRFFYIRFKDRTEPKIDFQKYAQDVSLKGEFIRLVQSQDGLSEEQKLKIIMTGIKALAGRLG